MDKLLFFDIDGTLAYPRLSPSSATVNAIRKARSNGHKVLLCTGRTVDSIPTAVAGIGFDGGIFSAGGLVMLGNTILAQHFMADKVVQNTLTLLYRKSLFFTLETMDGRYRSENGHEILSQVDMTCISNEMQQFTTNIIFDPATRPMSEYNGQPIYKIAYYSADHSITNQLSDELHGIAKIVQFDNIPGLPLTLGEISDFSVNKGLAMMDICKHLGKTAADCIAYGDSMNDSEILVAAGLGIAMGNAAPGLKELADIVCDSCENDGVARSMHDLGLT